MIQIGNAERLTMLALARALEPPPPVDFNAWAENNIVFSERESPLPGPYSAAQFPHLVEIFRALSPDDPCRTVTVMGSAQIGKTVIGNIYVGGSVAMDPCDVLVTHPTDDNARRWSKMKLSPMLKGTAALMAIFPQKPRDGLDSVLYKERIDGTAAILISGANSPSSLSQVSMRRQVQDDLSKWEANAAGDPEGQADNRSRAYEFAKVLKLSTPLVLPGCRISKSYEAGTQEQPYVPCPHCDHFQVLEWENMLAVTDPDNPAGACFSCVNCDAPIEEHHRPAMIGRLEWRAHNEAARRDHRSFWIWSVYSVLQSFERIYREWIKAKGDGEAERTFLNDTCGKAYRAQSEAPPWEKLRDRAAASSYRIGQVPPGALLLFMGIDCQVDRVECHVIGFGREFKRATIDYRVIPGHITDQGCQDQLDAMLAQTYANAFGHRLPIELAAIDGNAWTEDVWGFVRRHPKSKIIMVRGDGRDAAPRFARVKRERNERTGKLLKYASRFYNVGVSILKMALYRDLGKEDPQARGAVQFPSGLDDEYFRQLTAERREAEKRNGFVFYRWKKDDTQRNEALDTWCQAEAAATKFGVRGLPDAIWDRLEAERETAAVPLQGDLEDLLAAAPGAPAPAPAPAVTPQPGRRRGRRMLFKGIG